VTFSARRLSSVPGTGAQPIAAGFSFPKGIPMRTARPSAALALSALACFALTACDEDSDEPAAAPPAAAPAFAGVKKIQVAGKAVNVSCAGEQEAGKPVVVLLHGGGDSLEKFAALQKTLSEKHRVCSYDRLGAGGSDQPDGPQSFESSGKVLTGVLGQLAADSPVVLAGHSLGGILAARYAPEHPDKVKGLVLMDATPSTQNADLAKDIPAHATGQAAEARTQNLAIFRGQNPEKLVIADGPVKSAGDIPVEVLKHGQEYLAASLPDVGPALEKSWTEGQQRWLELSSKSKLVVATKSGHYIYEDEPNLAVQAIEEVASQVAGNA
jgi:pimeloyl-ACP methyl ester carboxylesterase